MQIMIFLHSRITCYNWRKKVDLEVDEDKKKFLSTVTAFNINARYDDYKMSFHQKCTLEFTSYWLEQIKVFRIWIMELIK